jgi:hypothetical protein
VEIVVGVGVKAGAKELARARFGKWALLGRFPFFCGVCTPRGRALGAEARN